MMVPPLPVTLVGENLGERHHCLNSAVNTSHERNESLQTIIQQPEVAPIDRIFKIDLASKYKDVNYIVRNLMDRDMLYVSRGLRCHWLLEPEYSHIINPAYLETNLYPNMITTAVNKMKNFIELRLKDPKRCQEFYEYYKSNFEIAIKYLWHCSGEFIKAEALWVIDKLTPKQLRILCEACPQVVKIYFEGLQANREALLRYLGSIRSYHNSIMNVLKADGDLFLDIIEKYYDKSALDTLSPSATRFIMKNYKKRYLAKPELYAGWVLNMKTVAMFLSSEEIKDIVIRMSRAEYLNFTFSYKQAEPFLKRLSAEERTVFRKQIFVDKSIGEKIELWPYPAPQRLILESESQPFQDIQHHPYEYESLGVPGYCFRGLLKKRQYCAYASDCVEMAACMSYPFKIKSSLDQLFDRYRFVSFDRTFFEFRKLLPTESSIEGRRNMMLVLISKAGGNEAKLEQLLEFLVERHSNEPHNLRDAVARSMVKRAFVWRLPAGSWELLLKWATTSVREILHANIMRHLLSNTMCPPADLAAYLLEFCDLTEYSLSAAEKACIAERLPALLISANAPRPLLDSIKAYNLRVEDVPGAELMLIAAAREDNDILRRLYESRIARRHLLNESFKIFQTDDAYMNALKHDVSVLKNGERFVELISNEKPNHDRFLRALVIYFSEPDGLAARHLVAIEKAIAEECRVSFARPLAYLFKAGNKSIEQYIEASKGRDLDDSQKKLAAAIRANAFVARPIVDIDVTEWVALGAKFVSNRVLLCSEKDVDKYIGKCLKWKKTMRVALRLAARSKSAVEVLDAVARTRPSVALKVVLSDLSKNTADRQSWDVIKPVVSNIDLSKQSLQHVRRALSDLDLKSSIQADYWTTVFGAFRKFSELQAMPMLCRIENVLTEADENLIKEIIREFLRDKLNKDTFQKDDFPNLCLCLYFRIIGKYLLLSKSESSQNDKIGTVCNPFFDKIEEIWEELNDKSGLVECLDDFVSALKYSKAFLDPQYVSSIPMFEKILERLSKVLPREKHFQTYVLIHLTMLYCRSIRQTLKQNLELFGNTKIMQEEGLTTVGFALGKYIGIEIQDLAQNYFPSIVDVYQKGLVNFIDNSFEYGKDRTRLVTAVIRGLIEGREESQLLAQHVLSREHSGYMEEHEKEEITKLLKHSSSEQVKFFLYADIYPY